MIARTSERKAADATGRTATRQNQITIRVTLSDLATGEVLGEMLMTPKSFSTGSVGLYAQGKMALPVDTVRQTTHQIGLSAIQVNSKPDAPNGPVYDERPSVKAARLAARTHGKTVRASEPKTEPTEAAAA